MNIGLSVKEIKVEFLHHRNLGVLGGEVFIHFSISLPDLHIIKLCSGTADTVQWYNVCLVMYKDVCSTTKEGGNILAILLL